MHQLYRSSLIQTTGCRQHAITYTSAALLVIRPSRTNRGAICIQIKFTKIYLKCGLKIAAVFSRSQSVNDTKWIRLQTVWNSLPSNDEVKTMWTYPFSANNCTLKKFICIDVSFVQVFQLQTISRFNGLKKQCSSLVLRKAKPSLVLSLPLIPRAFHILIWKNIEHYKSSRTCCMLFVLIFTYWDGANHGVVLSLSALNQEQ